MPFMLNVTNKAIMGNVFILSNFMLTVILRIALTPANI